jgi:hypothetical protein
MDIYKDLEKRLEKACAKAHRDFNKKFNSEVYVSAGGSKLEAFITALKLELEAAATAFITQNTLEKNTEARRKIFSMVKLHAKKCVETFSKI